MNKNIKNGFTLIEILIVITIIGLLTSVVLVGLGSFRSRGRDARRIADVRETQNALELYYSKKQEYPQTSDWKTLKELIANADIGVSSIPNDPLSSQDYLYGSDGQGYIIGAKLEDDTNSNLKDSFKGTEYEVNCSGPVYCVKF
jgi:general secretion pathway protein G